MADEDTIFEDGENVQLAIAKALQERKALLCFVTDGGDESTLWEAALLDLRRRDKMLASTVALRLTAGTEQAGFLHAVCPVQSVPAVVIILNAQVVANYQKDHTTFDQFQQQLEARYSNSTETQHRSNSAASPVTPGYIDLPPPGGRMRLPSNAYDRFRELTLQYVNSGTSGKALLHIQLMLLESLSVEVVNTAVRSMRQEFETLTNPSLSETVQNVLLNTPAARLNRSAIPVSSPPAAFLANTAQGQPASLPSDLLASPSQSRNSASPPPPSNTTVTSQPSPPASSSASSTSQRAEYIATQKKAEAERVRIKAQIEADRRARREADRKTHEEAESLRRRAELSDLRKANSTTSDPKATDVRIQVRTFDGSTIRSSFAAEASISKDVRPWIDAEVRKKESGAHERPYDLKLILTPLPNRTIEASEEDVGLSDVEGVRGSATLVMVPVRGYVESYSATGSGVAGTVMGGVQSIVGAGVGLVGSAAGIAFGALGRLMGTTVPSQTEEGSRVPAESREEGSSRRDGVSNVKIRTLADQQRDEEEAHRRQGSQLYNGMGLNVQPRKDDEEGEKRQ